jgi:hypothetical protein
MCVNAEKACGLKADRSYLGPAGEMFALLADGTRVRLTLPSSRRSMPWAARPHANTKAKSGVA